MITIRFSGRSASPRVSQIGEETDQRAETIRFLLPQVTDNQTEWLMLLMPDGTADEMRIRDGMVTLPARLTEIPGRTRAWVEILGTEDTTAWNSELFYLEVGDLPPISERTEQQYPTAIQEALNACHLTEGYYQAAMQAASIILASTGLMNIREEGGILVIDKATLTDPDGYEIAVHNGYTGTREEWELACGLVAGYASTVNVCVNRSNEAVETANGAVTTANGAVATANNALNRANTLIRKETVTVPASAWTGSIAPYTAEADCAIAGADNVLIVGVGGSLTAAQYREIAAARFMCTGQAAGKITLTAFGTKPENAINVNVLGVAI